jgi:26S proteasome regulatory subunit N5
MAKTEKIAYILEQVRLCLAKKDYIRAQILARKISPRAFQKQQGDSKGEIGIEGTAIEEADKVLMGVWACGRVRLARANLAPCCALQWPAPACQLRELAGTRAWSRPPARTCLQGIPSLPELKLRYYELMIAYHQHSHNYLEVCRCYKAIYESEGVQADASQWQPVSALEGLRWPCNWEQSLVCVCVGGGGAAAERVRAATARRREVAACAVQAFHTPSIRRH